MHFPHYFSTVLHSLRNVLITFIFYLNGAYFLLVSLIGLFSYPGKWEAAVVPVRTNDDSPTHFPSFYNPVITD